MSVELNPAGVACNIACTYCYEHPMRDALNVNVPWDWEKVKAALDKEGYFTLHGGEPLVIPIRRLDQILEYGYQRHGSTGIQTNGTLITDEHIELFKKYRTQVGISFDGPGECSLSRWAGTREETLMMAWKTDNAIKWLLHEGLNPSLIVTLWSGNTVLHRFIELIRWFEELDGLGLKWVNLHWLEVDSPQAERMRVDPLLLSERIKTLMELETEFKNLRFENFRQFVTLLRRSGEGVHCVWDGCDVMTTPAVQGIDGQGNKTNCGRTNKTGVNWTKAEISGKERLHALYNTPYNDGGCKGCRFFLMCKGECPGTGLDGDWRNRTEHCGVIYSIFEHYERKLIELGEVPASVSPNRGVWESELLRGTSGNRPHGDAPHGDAPHGDHTDARVQAIVEVR